jgi:hypothetical protein
MFREFYYEYSGACDARSIGFLAVKSCSKAFLHLSWGMGKVHAFRDAAFLRWLVLITHC